MANRKHLDILEQGVGAWNLWRRGNPSVKPNLSGVDFSGRDLFGINFNKANLKSAVLTKVNLVHAKMSKAELTGADLRGADLRDADLKGADLRGADLADANLVYTDFRGANLSSAYLESAYATFSNFSRANLRDAYLGKVEFGFANLSRANLTQATLNKAYLIDTNLSGAILTGCSIFGISAWGVNLNGAEQSNLKITPAGEPAITVDNLEVAQFIYLLLNSPKIRDVIDTITSKAVLILGRFTPERKAVLDAIRKELRKYDYLPILFDFDKPSSRNLTETVSTLAHMVRFIIADITAAKSIPQELGRIVPMLPSVPVQPILQARAKEYAMFVDFLDYPWVLMPYRYSSVNKLLASIKDKVIVPAKQKAEEIEKERKRRYQRSVGLGQGRQLRASKSRTA